MLEFIVLGEIPGTSVHITFLQVLLAGAILLACSELRILVHRKQLIRLAQNWINQIAL